MFRRTGIASTFLPALVIALVPALPAQAGVAPAAPIDEAPATAPAGDLERALVEDGFTSGEARSYVATLDAQEREFVAARVEKAKAGGLIFLVPLVPFIVGALVWLGIVGAGAVSKKLHEGGAPGGGEQQPDAAKAPERGAKDAKHDAKDAKADAPVVAKQ